MPSDWQAHTLQQCRRRRGGQFLLRRLYQSCRACHACEAGASSQARLAAGNFLRAEQARGQQSKSWL